MCFLGHKIEDVTSKVQGPYPQRIANLWATMG